jgi:hypothetical protein
MEQEPTYTTKKVKSWNQFKTFADQLSENWLFRGQSDAAWDLKTSFERTDFFRKYEGVEWNFLTEYQRGAKNFLSEKEIPEHLIEWLALMQHHGAPTRLIDFTKSSYVASYFAFENANPTIGEVAVWGINIGTVEDKMMQYLDLRHSPEYEERRSHFRDEDFEKTRRKFTDKDYEHIFWFESKSCIIPIEPFHMNRRYSLQQSSFISAGNSVEPFMEQLKFLESAITKSVVKIVLPSILKNEALRDLQKMNINRASIFPDLDGYSLALKMKYNSMLSTREYSEKQLKLLTDKKFKLHV